MNDTIREYVLHLEREVKRLEQEVYELQGCMKDMETEINEQYKTIQS